MKNLRKKLFRKKKGSKMKKSFIQLVTLTTMLIAMVACKQDPTKPGLEYMPDMYRSPAIEAYVDYGEVRGRTDNNKKRLLTALTPPLHTIPFYGKMDSASLAVNLPYQRLANSAMSLSHGVFEGIERSSEINHYDASAADNNPIPSSAAVVAKGKELYTAMCQHCHGEQGDGQGPMVKSGAYNGVPNYKDADRASKSDGQWFYSIYYGKGMMGAHRSLLSKEEIWSVIHYLRTIAPRVEKVEATSPAAPAAPAPKM